jgi:hypothetical protein
MALSELERGSWAFFELDIFKVSLSSGLASGIAITAGFQDR